MGQDHNPQAGVLPVPGAKAAPNVDITAARPAATVPASTIDEAIDRIEREATRVGPFAGGAPQLIRITPREWALIRARLEAA